ncbi:MAG: phosphatidylinositol kinase [Patescibacteria group bacterium]|nr:phosphatidylinositol kinase [Patescibacteria group bacterium]
MKKLDIIEVPLHKYESLEPLGTKRKFWFQDDNDNLMKLFKIGRPNTGENWVEVVVAEICKLLNIPHAKYEFAKWNNKEGTISTTFVPKGYRLVHGNELLAKTYERIDENIEYPIDGYKIREYQLKLIMVLMKSKLLKLPISYTNIEVKAPLDIFIGYIMLDCLISNPDRHHENWGWIVSSKGIYLSPTYDHASGLGCRESDDIKLKRLQSKDKGFQVENFVKKAKTPFHNRDKNLKTIEAFNLCAYSNKTIAKYWLEKVENLDMNKVRDIFNKIPDNIISEVSIEFALKILEENRKRLMETKEALSK